ncbi:hypothetical protein POM88_016094 [Heracleum sosnowskyi]|uniref:Uncharacterized protein n=1 Tax=Heracleum sosnowskyi TaxID=360622 RepID=A0AAD8MWJ4_9APIA|nr:hypothetical protein POM88_016094 [Heracleum sosnowskyi]
MKSENNNVGTLPIDMIVTLMKLLVVESFKDFFNFFIAWARTQRSEQLRINDAIFYGRCRDIVCGAGNIERHFTVLGEMASTGHFLYVVDLFVLRNLYKKQRSSVSTVDDLKARRSHPHYRMSIGSVVNGCNGCGMIQECLFCDIATLLNVLTNNST